MGQFRDVAVIFIHAVVKSWDVHHLCEARFQRVLGTVHALCDLSGRVEAMADVLQTSCDGDALLAPLFRYLVADGVHHQRGMVAVVAYEVLDVLVGPLVEEAGVAVLALRIAPHVEALGHDHHAQRVVDLHLHCRRHVVGRADGVAAHVFENLHLADERRLVDSGAERSEVVVEAYALELTAHAVELEAMLTREGDRADACLHCAAVHDGGVSALPFDEFDLGLIERWCLR